MQPPPKGDPPFLIDAPTNGSVLGPTFSVNGSGPANMTNINATVGNSSQPTMQQPSGCWEAIFSNMATGTYAVSASSSAGNATPGGISVTVDASPGISIGTVTPPPGPMMDGAGDPQTNPWSGWKITGLYNPAVIKKVWIYLTHKGEDVKVFGNTAWGEASLGANGTNTWSRDLGFVPQGFRGNGFLIHYNAHRLNDVIVHGTIPNFFNGPN